MLLLRGPTSLCLWSCRASNPGPIQVPILTLFIRLGWPFSVRPQDCDGIQRPTSTTRFYLNLETLDDFSSGNGQREFLDLTRSEELRDLLAQATNLVRDTAKNIFAVCWFGALFNWDHRPARKSVPASCKSKPYSPISKIYLAGEAGLEPTTFSGSTAFRAPVALPLCSYSPSRGSFPACHRCQQLRYVSLSPARFDPESRAIFI